MHHIVAYPPSDPLLFFSRPASWRHQLQHDIRYISFMARSTSFRGIPSRVAAVAFLVSTLHWNDPNPGGRLGGQNSHNGWTTRNILKKYQTVVGQLSPIHETTIIFCQLLSPVVLRWPWKKSPVSPTSWSYFFPHDSVKVTIWLWLTVRHEKIHHFWVPSGNG